MTRVIESPVDIQQWVRDRLAENQSVGFVPTMGSFHRGHRALMKASVEDNDVSVVSLFVNPTQFSSDDNVRQYPRDFEQDRDVLEEENVDVVFHPDSSEVYPEGDVTKVLVQNKVTSQYEGEFKPRFFPGVARVVAKLLNLVPADRVYFGEKDLQQLLMIRRMIRDLHFPQDLRTVPVIRDEHGIAYSSRNRRLEESDWQTLRKIREIMMDVKERADDLTRSELTGFRDRLVESGVELNYLDIISYPSFECVEPSDQAGALIFAGHVGAVRVKDNLPLHADSIRELEQRHGSQRTTVST